MRTLIFLLLSVAQFACSTGKEDQEAIVAYHAEYSDDLHSIVSMANEMGGDVREVSRTSRDGVLSVRAIPANADAKNTNSSSVRNSEFWSLMNETGVDLVLVNGGMFYLLLPGFERSGVDIGVELVYGELPESQNTCS
ncbi:MAG: hypothetical protein AB8G16_15485 [Gammaproteobacteria bacterium]